ncbi:hypothetical protein QK910_13475 [Lactococcus cremoris]|uniref:hypothetical protein n=1 Tax=Lactococcus lactis subsp. cremoris TaxID=1359 RepID=UPI003A80BD6A
MWILEGFPKLVDKLSDIAVMTSGRSGVVAALSKYIILFFLPFVVISGYFYKDLIFFVKVSVFQKISGNVIIRVLFVAFMKQMILSSQRKI